MRKSRSRSSERTSFWLIERGNFVFAIYLKFHIEIHLHMGRAGNCRLSHLSVRLFICPVRLSGTCEAWQRCTKPVVVPGIPCISNWSSSIGAAPWLTLIGSSFAKWNRKYGWSNCHPLPLFPPVAHSPIHPLSLSFYLFLYKRARLAF